MQAHVHHYLPGCRLLGLCDTGLRRTIVFICHHFCSARPGLRAGDLPLEFAHRHLALMLCMTHWKNMIRRSCAAHDFGVQALQAYMCVGECISPLSACCRVTAENDLRITQVSGPRKVSSTSSGPHGVPGLHCPPRAQSRAQENGELLSRFPWKSFPWKSFPWKSFPGNLSPGRF